MAYTGASAIIVESVNIDHNENDIFHCCVSDMFLNSYESDASLQVKR